MTPRHTLLVFAITTTLGLLVGAAFIGVLEIFPALVLPHGGWNHISSEVWTKFVVSTAIGGMIGLITGAVIQFFGRP